MANKSILALSVLTTVGLSQAVFAESHDTDGTQSDGGDTAGMTMGDGHAQKGMMGGKDGMKSMMQNMMKMHASMMGGSGGMMGHSGGMMGGSGGMMGMMDRDMMSMMMPGGDPQNMSAHMGAKLKEFDVDADGALTLEEFEALHMSALRERMVDRFQHLDADGDGQITQQEMDAAGNRMGAMKNTSSGSDTKAHHGKKSQ
jgi:hypothetical protein